jgi:uncharacterized phiE125 gp8 family phage protein
MELDPRRVKITTKPEIEPISLVDAKLHLRIDGDAENSTIDRLIGMARQHCEDVARRAFITRTFTAKLDAWPPRDRMIFPYPPLVGVTSVSYTDKDGVTATWSSSNYIVDNHSEPGQLVLKTDVAWPTEVTLQSVNGITVVFTAGYGTTAKSVPNRYRQAMLLMLGHLYENREAVLVAQGISALPLAMGLEDLLLMDRGGW